MQEKPFRQRATRYLSTHPALMITCFAAIIWITRYVFLLEAESWNRPWIRYFVYVPACGGIGYYMVKWLHSVFFSEEGILFFFCGIEYRRISWKEITQAGMTTEYKASKYSLVLTPSGCPTFDGSGTSTYYVEWYRFRLVLLDATKENIAAIKRFYGELDYQMNSFFDK